MAGSLRNFQYVADDGQIYLFKADESNVESVNLLVANIVTANINRPGIPRNVTPRRVYYSNADRTRTLGIIASTQAIYLAPPATIPDTLPSSTAVLSLSRKTPERVRLFSNIDSGLTDGDAPL